MARAGSVRVPVTTDMTGLAAALEIIARHAQAAADELRELAETVSTTEVTVSLNDHDPYQIIENEARRNGPRLVDGPF